MRSLSSWTVPTYRLPAYRTRNGAGQVRHLPSGIWTLLLHGQFASVSRRCRERLSVIDGRVDLTGRPPRGPFTRASAALRRRSSSISAARSRISPPSASSGCSARSSGSRPRRVALGDGAWQLPDGGATRSRAARGGAAAAARVAGPVSALRPGGCCARRAYASTIGCGAQFALAAMRLAFCGGFDLEDPEILAEAAAAAGIPLAGLLRRDRRSQARRLAPTRPLEGCGPAASAGCRRSASARG